MSKLRALGMKELTLSRLLYEPLRLENTPDNQVKVKLVSPPLYVLTSTCLEKAVGIATLEASIIDIRRNIEAAGGNCVVKMEPKAVTENDDAELQALMEKRERENAEVSGDESMSESDENAVEVNSKVFPV